MFADPSFPPYIRLLQVAEAFLKKKATYDDLKKAVENAKKALGDG